MRAFPAMGRKDLRSAPASLKKIPPAQPVAPVPVVEDSNDPLAARVFGAAVPVLAEKTTPEARSQLSTAPVLASHEASACLDLLRLLSLKLYGAIDDI
jgi:hypothetical protein